MTLSTVPNGEILKVLIVANISRPNNFEVLTAGEWKTICEEIKKDFPDLTYEELKGIVLRGAKGKYNKHQFPINCFTIFKWIEMYLEIKKSMPKKQIACPSNIESFYWVQMSETEQQKWLNNLPKQIDEHKK